MTALVRELDGWDVSQGFVRAIEVVLVDPTLGLVTDFIEAVEDPGIENLGSIVAIEAL